MTLDLKPGGYKLVAWAGLEEDITCYNINENLTRGASTLEDLTLRLNLTGSFYNKSLSDLWHGMIDNYVVNNNAPVTATIPLVYDINRFKVLLQSTSSNQLSKDNYSFSIRSNNHQYNYDNSLKTCNELY